MININANGNVINLKIKLAINTSIQKRKMLKVSGIIVHQTGGATAQSALNSYKSGGSGAHFLIDKDGTIYQTASLQYQTWHVGKLKSRCLVSMKCSAAEFKQLKKFNPTAEHKREVSKNVPDRYPANQDSIGIEIVGEALPYNVPSEKRVYETVTIDQNASLKWLTRELCSALTIPPTEIFRHPTVSRKNPTEAATARW